MKIHYFSGDFKYSSCKRVGYEQNTCISIVPITTKVNGPNRTTCLVCMSTEEFKQDLLKLELEYDGNIIKYYNAQVNALLTARRNNE